MARLGSIYLGGSEGLPDSGTICNSGVGFGLTSPSPFTSVYLFEDGVWEIEIQKGQPTIVARTFEVLPPDEILDRGLEACQKYLDLVSVAKQRHRGVKSPEEAHILLFKSGEEWVLRVISIAELSAGISASATLFRDEIVVSPPPKPRLKWIPAFRYYRLSRMSNDLFEAYRNLFLSFESLVYDIVPISPHERETVWLRRALNEIDKEIPLADYVPAGTPVPVEYFMKMQYDTRCSLFHAKGNQCILPHACLDLRVLSNAYEQLFQLWQRIATRYYNTSREPGTFTYAGFGILMDDAFGDGFEILATDDPTPVTGSETEVSPLNHPAVQFPHLRYESKSIPGRVFLIGCLNDETLQDVGVLHRFCTKARSVIFTVNYVEEGLFPIGVDRLECYQGIRLKNNNLP